MLVAVYLVHYKRRYELSFRILKGDGGLTDAFVLDLAEFPALFKVEGVSEAGWSRKNCLSLSYELGTRLHDIRARVRGELSRLALKPGVELRMPAN
jgi:hypothetical protein